MIRAIKPRMQRHWRKRRMEAFIELMRLKQGSRIIDLGGLPEFWETIALDLDITLLNLPGVLAGERGAFTRQYQFVEADACELLDLADNSFDIAFSNGVIEHVGSLARQKAFAKTVRRLAPSYWIQTPSMWFPIEAHCNLPFWWFYPPSLKNAWIRRWQRQGQEFKWKQMSETQVLSLGRLKTLFPEAKVYTEYVAGFPKSYSMYVPIQKERSRQ
ncbi:methylase involved in ubiquinone/menaquinone biosynthesis [Pleurocapsa sp. PCC 7327]|nr:methylase involved in ubiquinone/menaquinone biosynthesis [Pleurocapsa sp. PCC 7327]